MESLPLLLILTAALFTKNNLLAAAAAIVLFLNLMRLQRFFTMIQNRGLEMGLLLLTVALLIPLGRRDASLKELWGALLTPLGLFAVVGGLLGAYLNSQGIELIAAEPSLVGGILIGVTLSVFCFGGVAVGPIMAAGITAVLAKALLR